MHSKSSIIEDFCAVLRSEISNTPISLIIKDDCFEVEYSSIKIVIKEKTEDKNIDSQYMEIDFMDALCRLRLLVIERFNRLLPNDERHSYFKNLDFEENKSSFFKTDTLSNILISY